MVLDKTKLEMALVRANKVPADLKSVCRKTYYNAISGNDVKLRTVMRLSDELGVDVAEIVKKE